MADNKRTTLIPLFDSLTDRLRWADGVLDAMLQNEHLDEPDSNAISNAANQVKEARKLTDRIWEVLDETIIEELEA